MSRAGLFERLAQRAKLPKSQAELIVETIFDCLVSAFRRDEKVEITDLGTFSLRRYQGYQGRNRRPGLQSAWTRNTCRISRRAELSPPGSTGWQLKPRWGPSVCTRPRSREHG